MTRWTITEGKGEKPLTPLVLGIVDGAVKGGGRKKERKRKKTSFSYYFN